MWGPLTDARALLQDEADCWVLNSCTVKDPSQAAFVNLLKRGRGRTVEVPNDHAADGAATPIPKPMPLVLAGCVPQADRNLSSLQGLGDGVSLVGVAQLERIVEVRRLLCLWHIDKVCVLLKPLTRFQMMRRLLSER
jgi:tRNA A37 methylthiotransferase MiaB